MSEIQAAIGLLNLRLYEEEKEKRRILALQYIDNLSHIKGIRIPEIPQNATKSYQYYLIIIEDEYKMSRNELYLELKKHNINARKYFYPLCSDYECYKNLSSAIAENLQVANDVKLKVLCLPFYGNIEQDVVDTICRVIGG